MAQALPRLNVQVIPGGMVEPPPVEGPDAIGDILAPQPETPDAGPAPERPKPPTKAEEIPF